MKQIWKYKIITTDEQTLSIPSGAIFLTVDIQREVPCVWAIVDPDEPESSYLIRAIAGRAGG